MISNTFVFFLRNSGEHLRRFRLGSVFLRSVKTDPCPKLVNYSSDVLNYKSKVLDISNMDKRCYIKIYVESSPQEICFTDPHH